MWNKRHIPIFALAVRILALSAAVFASSAWAATVYKSVDAEGRVTYSDQAPGDAEMVEVLDYQVQERSPEQIEGDLARIEAMRETTDRMAADRRERESARAKARAEAEAARAAAYQQQYPDYYYDDGYYGGSVSTSSRYSYSGWGGRIYWGSGPVRPRPPLVRPPHHRPPHVRPPFRHGHPRRGDVAEPGFSYNAPANQIRRRYTGKAREVFYGR
jgi:hypothetical protein